MGFWEMALLASALSIDAVNIGVSCGLDGVKIPCLSRMLVVLVTILTTGVSVMIGEMFQGKIPQSAGAFVSGGLLFLLGLYMIFCGVKKYRAKKREQPLNQQEGRVKKGKKRFSPVRVLSDLFSVVKDMFIKKVLSSRYRKYEAVLFFAAHSPLFKDVKIEE